MTPMAEIRVLRCDPDSDPLPSPEMTKEQVDFVATELRKTVGA